MFDIFLDASVFLITYLTNCSLMVYYNIVFWTESGKVTDIDRTNTGAPTTRKKLLIAGLQATVLMKMSFTFPLCP